ncbi:MAG: diadenylate cyclase CdaA [Chloroflexota bacterium]
MIEVQIYWFQLTNSLFKMIEPMIPLQLLFDSTLFRLSTLGWTEILDLLLVTIAFFLALRLVQGSGAALLLRGALVLVGVLFVITIILPLPAFDWMVRGLLIAILITTPIIFQPELRRLLERIGRNTGISWEVRQTTAEQIVPRLVRALENMSANRTGALLVLEGNTSLQDVVETGVTIGGEVTSELLQAIFFPNNPLHDGAAIIRADRLVAAGCVLPLTERPLHTRRRLGTRHRAAVGLSEKSDALVVVVSEETGTISVAQGSQLERPVDAAGLRKHLYEFYSPANPLPTISLWSLASRTLRRLWRRPPWPTLRQVLNNAGLLVLSLLLALAIWTFVIQSINPAERVRLENIPLQAENIPPETALMTSLPGTVSAIIQTTADLRPTLGSRSFQAVVSLAGLAPGEHRLPVDVVADTPQVQVLSVDPPVLDLTLAPIISQTIEISVELLDQQSLSRAYQIVGSPLVDPAQVVVIGPEPLLKQVDQVKTTLSLANASGPVREMRPLRALDEAGRELTGLTLQPAASQVSLTIQRRTNARDMGVRVVTKGVPASGYWLSGVLVSPASVTVQGTPDQLEQVGNFVDTLPVDLNNAAGDISLQVPLDLPTTLQAVGGEGNRVNTVTVQLRIEARQSNLSVTRPVKLIGVTPQHPVTVTPAQVTLILSGPLPTLTDIETDPELVQVLVELAGQEAGSTATITPTIIAPAGVKTQIVPPTVSATLISVQENNNLSGR